MGRANRAADEIRNRSGNGNVVVKQLDLESLQSVRALVADVKTSEDRLDILINNAGVLLAPIGYQKHNYSWRIRCPWHLKFDLVSVKYLI